MSGWYEDGSEEQYQLEKQQKERLAKFARDCRKNAGLPNNPSETFGSPPAHDGDVR